MRLLRNNRGAVMPLVLIVLTLAVIFGFTSLNMMDSQSRFNVVEDSSKKAIEYAEAGYNAYLWHLNDDVNFYSTAASTSMQGVDIPFMDGYYSLEVTKPSDTDRFITIKSTGWTKAQPNMKRTLEARIRKKQFVHHVYVSNSEGDNIWWTSGDESHGPFHTNGDLRIQQRPIFYDTVTYNKNKTLFKGTGYNPDFKVKDPVQPVKMEPLIFPATNIQLKQWAEKDNMVFKGRTCIYLDGDSIKVRNKTAINNTTIPLSSIKNKVIYVEADTGTGTGKFDLNMGNIFIAGELKGTLTIAASNDIYITYSDPTNWYDYDASNMKDSKNKPNQPPTSFRWSNNRNYDYPEDGGIKYKSTTFTPSYKPAGKDYWIREASGKDMLGLVANNYIYILHYGWPKMPVASDGGSPYWNFEWRWKDSGNPKNIWVPTSTNSRTYDVAPEDITIHAALFAVNRGFGYEENDEGPDKGDIVLWGNITQKIRQGVGTTAGVGYKKKYSHDPRMFYDYPPHILEPVNVGWEIHDWKEIN